VWHDGRDLPPCRSAAGSWRRPAPPCRQNQAPAAVPDGVRDLTPWGTTPGACCRGVRRQMYISRKFWFGHLFFENKTIINIYKKIDLDKTEGYSSSQFLASKKLKQSLCPEN
jgi:hypothetical protein